MCSAQATQQQSQVVGSNHSNPSSTHRQVHYSCQQQPCQSLSEATRASLCSSQHPVLYKYKRSSCSAIYTLARSQSVRVLAYSRTPLLRCAHTTGRCARWCMRGGRRGTANPWACAHRQPPARCCCSSSSSEQQAHAAAASSAAGCTACQALTTYHGCLYRPGPRTTGTITQQPPPEQRAKYASSLYIPRLPVLTVAQQHRAQSHISLLHLGTLRCKVWTSLVAFYVTFAMAPRYCPGAMARRHAHARACCRGSAPAAAQQWHHMTTWHMSLASPVHQGC